MSPPAGVQADPAEGTVRELRLRDVPRLAELLRTEFPEEEELLGTRPEGVVGIARRLFRWDTQLLLGLLRLFGAAPARFLVVEADGRLAATTLLSFTGRAGYVSMVMVDPAYRRRGFARRLLREAQLLTRRRGRPHVALDVLATNGPALALYDGLGFRTLRSLGYYVCEPPAASPGATEAAAVRPCSSRDAPTLARLASRGLPPEVRAVLPIRAAEIAGSGWANRILRAETAAWVYDRGRGPEAHVSASFGDATAAGHLSTPIVGADVPAEGTAALLATALAWLAARGVPRALARAADDDRPARAALDAAGFRPALRLRTLVRSSA